MNQENILIQAGLSEEQALIYEALIDRGPQKASNLSTWTGVKRGLTYKILEQLESMGLVEKKGGDGTIATFFPNHPQALMGSIERKEQQLKLTKETLGFALGELSSKFNLLTGKPNVLFFEGKEGVGKVIRDSYTSKDEILTYADNEAMNKYYPELYKENVATRKKLKVKKRIISIDTPYIHELAKNDDPEITKRRLVNSTDHFATVMQIYDNKVTYITLDPDKSIGVVIEDASIYKMHKTLFEALWENAKQIPL